MIIGNVNGFHNLVKGHNIPGLERFMSCYRSFSSMCNCQKAAKQKKMVECSRLYSEFITANGQNLKNWLKSKTTDKTVVFRQNDHQDLITIKLD